MVITRGRIFLDISENGYDVAALGTGALKHTLYNACRHLLKKVNCVVDVQLFNEKSKLNIVDRRNNGGLRLGFEIGKDVGRKIFWQNSENQNKLILGRSVINSATSALFISIRVERSSRSLLSFKSWFNWSKKTASIFDTSFQIQSTKTKAVLK